MQKHANSLVLVLIALATAVLLAGCGGGDDDSGSSEDKAVATAPEDTTTAPEGTSEAETAPSPDGSRREGDGGASPGQGGGPGEADGGAPGSSGSSEPGGAPPAGNGSSGGGGGSGASGQDSFAKQAKAICDSTQKQALARAGKLVQKAGGETPQLGLVVSSALVPGLEARVRGLRALTPPSGDAAQVDAILTAIEEVIAEAKADPAGFAQGGDQYVEPQKLADEYGIGECGGL